MPEVNQRKGKERGKLKPLICCTWIPPRMPPLFIIRRDGARTVPTQPTLGSRFPRSQVPFLLRREAVTTDSHTSQLERRHLFFYRFGDQVDARIQRFLILNDPVDR